MSPLTAVLFATFASCAFSQDSVEVKVSDLMHQLPTADGRTDFTYYTTEADCAAKVRISYITKYESEVNEYVTEQKNYYNKHSQIVSDCSAKLGSSENLNKAVKESLVKLQEADNTVRAIEVACMSYREPRTEDCVKASGDARKSIASQSSEEEYEKINQVKNQAVADAKSSLKQCIIASTSL